MSNPFRYGLDGGVLSCRVGRSVERFGGTRAIRAVGIIDKVAPDLLVAVGSATLAARVATYVSLEELRGPFARMASV